MCKNNEDHCSETVQELGIRDFKNPNAYRIASDLDADDETLRPNENLSIFSQAEVEQAGMTW